MLALFDQLHQLNYFSTKQVIALGLDPNHAHVWLHREVAKGTIYRISNGFYVTHEKKQQLIYTKMRGHWTYYLACQVLYPGAVISHETVLGQHQIIPEMLTGISCVTQRKTRVINTPRQYITYRHQTDRFWWGYESIVREGMMIHTATPEKALFDRLWRRNDIVREQSRFVELRLELDLLDYNTFSGYIERSQSPKMYQVLLFLKPLRGS